MEGSVLALLLSKVLLLVLLFSAALVELEFSEILVAIEVFESFSVLFASVLIIFLVELGYVLPLLDTVSALTDSGLVSSKPRTVATILVNKYIYVKK